MKKMLVSVMLVATCAMAVDPVILHPAGPLSQVTSKAIWTSGMMTGQQAAYLFGGVPLPQMLDLSNCPTNDHHIVVVNVNLTNKTYAAIALDNTNVIGFVSACWWPDDELATLQAKRQKVK